MLRKINHCSDEEVLALRQLITALLDFNVCSAVGRGLLLVLKLRVDEVLRSRGLEGLQTELFVVTVNEEADPPPSELWQRFIEGLDWDGEANP